MAGVFTESGEEVPALKMRPGLFIDNTTVLYGPSKTGKTVLVKNIMKEVNGRIEQVVLVSPTEPSNRAFEGFIDPTFIHYTMRLSDPADKKDTDAKAALRFLETVYERQKMMAGIYNKTNNISTLSSLYKRMPHKDRTAGDLHIASLERKRRRTVERVQRLHGDSATVCDKKVKGINTTFKEMLILVYKKFLTPGVPQLWAKKDLTEDERYSLHYLHLNPRLLLVFDDCAAELKPFFNKEIFRKLFYQNRHSYITVVICCQDDTDLPTNLRKNAFISIFTSSIVALANFGRKTNAFPKKTQKYVEEVVPAVFDDPETPFRKLVYIREDEQRQHFYEVAVPVLAPFMFGSPALGELCAAVRSEGVSLDTRNAFFDDFKVV